MEDAFSNTSGPDFEVTNILLQSLIDPARKQQESGAYNANDEPC